jgi:hypothetical protein
MFPGSEKLFLHNSRAGGQGGQKFMETRSSQEVPGKSGCRRRASISYPLRKPVKCKKVRRRERRTGTSSANAFCATLITSDTALRKGVESAHRDTSIRCKFNRLESSTRSLSVFANGTATTKGRAKFMRHSQRYSGASKSFLARRENVCVL